MINNDVPGRRSDQDLVDNHNHSNPIERLRQTRDWARDRFPFWIPHVGFTALLMVPSQEWFLVDYLYLFIFLPLLITRTPKDLEALSRSWVLRACFLALIYMALSPFWTSGPWEGHGRTTFSNTVDVLVYIVVTAEIVRRRPRYIDDALMVVGTVAVFNGAYSLIYPVTFGDGRLAIWPWENPNTGAAVFGLLAVGLAAGIWHRKPFVAESLFRGLAALFIVACIFLAQTRAAMVGIAGSAAACFLLVGRHRHIVVGLVVVVACVSWFTLPGLFSRGDGGRLALLAGYWEITLENLWLGHGIQNEFKYQVASQGQLLAGPHNMLLTAALYGGLVGALLLAALYAAILFFGAQAYRRVGQLAPFGIAVYLVTHGMFETIPLTQPSWRWVYEWLPIGLVAGAELASRAIAPTNSSVSDES